MMTPWIGVNPCEHKHRWMVNTKECGDCWGVRWDKEHDEFEPFEAGGEDTDWTDELEACTAEYDPIARAG